MILVWSLQKLTVVSPDEHHMNMFENIHEQLYYAACDNCYPSIVYENLRTNKIYRYPGIFTKGAIEQWYLNIPYLNYSNV